MKKILFVCTERIGDSLTITPCIRSIFDKFRSCEIDLICKQSNYEVFSGNPYLNEIFIPNKLKLFLSIFLKKKKKYDLCFCYSVNKLYINYSARVSENVNCFSNRNLINSNNNIRLFHLAPTNERSSMHIAIEKSKLLAMSNIKVKSYEYDFFISPRDIHYADRIRLNLKKNFNKIFSLKLHSDPKKKYRDWPKENFRNLISLILKRNPKVAFLVIGSISEKESIDEMSNLFSENVFGFYNQSIKKSAALISISDLYIGVDTGMTHIATCFKLPIVGIYHKLNPSSRGGPLNYAKDHSIDMSHYKNKVINESDIAIISHTEVFDKVISTKVI